MEISLPQSIIEIATDLYGRDYGLSGPELHRFFGQYTDVLGSYPMANKPSRWMVFQIGLETLDNEHQHAALRALVDGDRREDPRLDKLKAFLRSGLAPVSQEMLADLDWVRVRSSWAEALDKASEQPAAAIRAARTTLESVCKHICDERGQSYPSNGELSDLYKAVQKCLDLGPEGTNKQVTRQLLSGLGTALGALGAMRNELGDAHGAGISSPTPRPLDARLVVNIAFALAQYFIDCHRLTPE
jgi:hypothetical protein